MVTFMIY